MTDQSIAARVGEAVAAVERDWDRARSELEDLVRIPSVSADPQHASDVRASADATAALLEASGLESVRVVTVDDSPPYVIGEWLHAPGEPTVLLYAHHDVQPAGYVERWSGDPFEPREIDGRMYGRGTADDKAGVVAHAVAASAWLGAAGALPCNVRILVEGEEEIGSPRLAAFLDAHGRELAADVLVLADAGNWSVGTPGLTCSLRGLTGGTVTVRALEGPVHSGMAGGPVPDPVLALAGMLATLVDEHGDPAFDGCFDDYRPPSAAERERIAALPDGIDQLRSDWGLRPGVELAGAPGCSVWERLWLRPAITIVGFDSHPVQGSSNQIVSHATARISVRVAPGQDPERLSRALHPHLLGRVPFGLELAFTPEVAVPAWECAPTGFAYDAARRALAAGFGTPPVTMGVGGTIPFVRSFVEAFGGIPALLFGPADPSSRIHGENESLHLGDWRSLLVSEVRLLAELGAGVERP